MALTVAVNRRKEQEDEYIGRGSKWGNQFSHKQGTKAKYVVATVEEAVESYEGWFMKQPNLIRDIHELKGKKLGCFCKPGPCHGDVLAGICNAFKVIVAGSRGFTDYDLLCAKLDRMLSKVTTREIIIVSGTARGADQMGEQYAKDRGYRCLRLPADWQKFGKRAGYMRNEDMARIADAAVLFWDGKSPGTKHMSDLADKYELQKRIVNY